MRGVDSTLYPIQRQHGGAALRAGILPADRQEGPPQPPLRNPRPTQGPPRLSLRFTPTFTAPEGVRIILRIPDVHSNAARATSSPSTPRLLSEAHSCTNQKRSSGYFPFNTDALRRSERSCHPRERRGGRRGRVLAQRGLRRALLP